MYKDKFEKELYKILGKLLLAIMRNEEIETRSGLSEEELNERYANKQFLSESHEHWCEQSKILQKDLCKALVDAKFQILREPCGKLSGIIKEAEKIFADGIKKHSSETIRLDLESDLSMDDRIKRLGEIELLCLTDIHPHPKIYKLYDEAVKCYFFGVFDACCIICRAVVEKIVKTRISHSKYKDLLKDGIKSSDKVSIEVILEKPDLLPDLVREELVSLYKRIISKADILLHDKEKMANENDARNSIKYLKLFIEKFPPVKIL